MAEFWYLYGQTFRQMGRFSLWTPLLIHGILAVILVLMHYYLFSSVSGSLVESWTRLINSDAAPIFYHYPNHFAVMPYFYGTARLVINVFTEALLFGIVIDLLIAVYRGEKPVFMQSVGRAFRRYFQLTVVWLVLIAILYFINKYFNPFIEDVIGYSLQGAPRRQFLAQTGIRIITVLIYSIWIFVIPSIMVGGVSFWNTVSRGFRMFLAHPFVAFGIVLIPYLIGLLPSWILTDPAKIVSNFYPELVFYLLLVSIGVDVVVNFILLGTSLKFYMDQST
jgi:hypothetical protein